MTITLSDAQPGDIVAFNTAGMFGRLIQAAQFLRRADRRNRKWHHVAVVVGYAGGDGWTERSNPSNWIVVQAARRVDRVWLDDVAPGRPFTVLRCPDGVNRAEVVAQAQACVGAAYGVLTIVSIAFNLITPRFIRIDFSRAGQWICSALGAWCLHAGGWLHPWPDVMQVTPADLVGALDA